MKQVFSYPRRVVQDEIDNFKHVNNGVYLDWLMSAASAHSESLGYGLQKFLEDGAGFVVRRHELDYLSPAFLGDEVVIETWIGDHSGAKSYREYKIVRTADQKTLMEAKTLWVYINLKTGRPQLIPQEIVDVFKMEHKK